MTNYMKTMKAMPQEERPYERCIRQGPQHLSDTELLAVLLRTGRQNCSALELADEILHLCPFESGVTGLLHLNLQQLREVRGIGDVKAVQILCLGELSRRISKREVRRRICFSAPSGVAEYYVESLRYEEQEVVCAVMLDTKNHLLGEAEISRGTVNQSLISPRELFLSALSFHAVSVILVHNHPSGDPSPSGDDQDVTERIRCAGELLGIRLVDHIIIGDGEYFSFMEHGLLAEHK
uniref:DNA repair protein radc n=1 Tax=Eubacterium cellulosolvens (strain ATCC 43171 / JCM 9499 / 6) TaxID=633697 RepID=I5AQT4_EUBC6